jgi:hypothetical protein
MKRSLVPAVLLALLAAPAAIPMSSAAPAPTKANEKYDTKHERNVLDFWQAKTDKPAPIVVWFHGGGFTQGDKRQIIDRDNVIDGFLKRGVSVASANYPFLKDASYQEIMVHCGRAVQFLRSKAKEWNLDPNKVGVAGVSAGALISEWLGYHEDLAKPGSSDPVERMSSTVSVVGAYWQPMGTEELVKPLMRPGGPPLILFCDRPPSDAVHHPKYSKAMQARAEELKIAVEIYGGPKNDIAPPPAGETFSTLFLKFFGRQLGVK